MSTFRKNQQGAVAILVALSLVILVGMLALVVDLGHLYLAKTGLQNAADAAALSGARKLDETLDGINNAVADATETAGQNTYLHDLGQEAVVLTSANIMFSNNPNATAGNWLSVAQAQAAPAGLTFIKVDTGGRSLATWFAPVLSLISGGNFSTTTTNGVAVAGRFMTPITPMGVCALRTAREAWVTYGAGANDQYKVELGYMQGVSYNFQDINNHLSGLAAGTQLYIHPTATPVTGCNPNDANANSSSFLCTGKSTLMATTGSTVYTNTGVASGKSISALNTRFDQYGPPLDSSLDSTVCAPDVNIKQYTPTIAANWMTSTSPPVDQASIFGLADWLAGASPAGGGVRQPLPATLVNKKENQGGCGNDCSDNYGVLWAYTQPVRISGSFTTADWAALYPSGLSSPAYVQPSPYKYGLANTGNSTYFQAPSHSTTGSVQPRRVLNMLIVQCPGAGGSCQPLTVLGVGKFFMESAANNSAWVPGEFAGLVPDSELITDIRLFH